MQHTRKKTSLKILIHIGLNLTVNAKRLVLTILTNIRYLTND